MAFAIPHLAKAELERKVLLVMSDGGDNSSQRRFDDVLKSTRRPAIAIYCIGIYSDADLDPNPGVLTEFVELTGGKDFFPSELKEVTETCVKMARIIRQQYSLSFAGAEDGQYHSIKITANDQRYGELAVTGASGLFPANSLTEFRAAFTGQSPRFQGTPDDESIKALENL